MKFVERRFVLGPVEDLCGQARHCLRADPH